MFLTKEQIEKYSKDFHYELSKEDLEKDWSFDKEYGFQSINMNEGSVTLRTINLKAGSDCYLRIPFKDLTQEQIEELIIKKD